MAYAQINYSQKLGNGPYTIAESGCFVTAFSNLLTRYGENVDPPTLNNFFNAHGTYLNAPEDGPGVRDDLGWGSVSAYDGNVIVTQIGGSGWPGTNDAIVKFVYRSPRTGQMVTHFCLVADHTNATIVDSWDGGTKVSPYGTPVAYALYERHAPQVVVPPPSPEAAAFAIENIPERTEELKIDTHLWDLNQRSWPALVNNPVAVGNKGSKFQTTQLAHHIMGGSYYLPIGSSSQGYNVVDCQDVTDTPAPTPPPPPEPAANVYRIVKGIPGYITSNDAANHIHQVNVIKPGDYSVFNEAHGMVNVTTKPGEAGSWINPADNTVDAPAPPPSFTKNTVEGIVFEVFPDPNPRAMYIKKVGGTEKWSFKNVANWRDFKSVEHVDYGTQVFIVGVAHHPIPPNGADYYMVDADFGDFRATGVPVNFYGFNHADLSETKPPVLADVTPPPPPEPMVAAPVVAAPQTNWKETFKPFPSPVHYIATRHLLVADINDTNPQPSMPLDRYEPGNSTDVGKVSVFGTVTKDGVSYYRLKTNNDPTFNYWYCVPKVDAATRTPNLLVAPTMGAAEPVSKVSIARDSLSLAKAHVENDLPRFLDDIIPAWLRKNKK